MKKIILTSVAFIIAITLTTSCNSDGNTGNGANDPTSQFEPNNLKDEDGKDFNQQQQDNDSSTTTNTKVDTAVNNNNH